MTSPKKTPANDPRVTLESLQERRREHANELDQIAESRGKLALAAAEGDMSALDQLRDLDERERTLRTSMSNVSAAIAHASELMKPIMAAERKAHFAANRAKAEAAREAFVAISAECDALMAKIAEKLRERETLAGDIVAHRFIINDAAWLRTQDIRHHAQYARPIALAAFTAGLGPFLPMLPMPSGADPQTLAEFGMTIRLPAGDGGDED